jgi:hypothetical protein
MKVSITVGELRSRVPSMKMAQREINSVNSA